MRAVVHVAMDLLREALARKWFLALGLGITVALAVVALSLRFEIVDGALAATQLFGGDVGGRVEAVDIALRAIFEGAVALVYFGGLTFGIVACSDFGPSLLAPGRIELLLALPVRKVELLFGTWLGVLALSTAGALYGAGGLALILGIKAGVWTTGPFVAALLVTVAFSAIYGAMLAVAVWVRSAALSAAVGYFLFFAGNLAGMKETLLPLFQEGFGRESFRIAAAILPRFSALGRDAMAIAGSKIVDWGALAVDAAGTVAFGLAALALATWRFEGKDY